MQAARESVAQAERTEMTFLAMAVVLFGVFLIWKKSKKLEKRMEENALALRFQIL